MNQYALIIIIISLLYTLYVVYSKNVEYFKPHIIPLDYSRKKRLQQCCDVNEQCYSKPPFKQKGRCQIHTKDILNKQYNLLPTSNIKKKRINNTIDIEDKIGTLMYNNMINDERDIVTGFDYAGIGFDSIGGGFGTGIGDFGTDEGGIDTIGAGGIWDTDVGAIGITTTGVGATGIATTGVGATGIATTGVGASDNTGYFNLNIGNKTNLNNNLGRANDLNKTLDQSGSNVDNSSLNPGARSSDFIYSNKNINNTIVDVYSSSNNDYINRVNINKLKPESSKNAIRFGSDIYNYASNKNDPIQGIVNKNQISKLPKKKTINNTRLDFDLALYRFTTGVKAGYASYNYIKKVI
jgi:hypothetical protein